MDNHKLRTIDLFCGAGGSSYGARMAGAEIVAGFDIWEPAQITFKTNFRKARIYSGDIRQVKPRNIKKEIGDIDLMLASPECTNHSIAKGSKERDEESKRTAFQVTRFARVFRPKYIVIENVVQMGSWSEQPMFLEELWDLDYAVKEIKLNAKNFGVAQSRNRLFLLCSRGNEIGGIDFEKNKEKFAHTIIDWSDKYQFSQLYNNNRALATLERAERAINELGKNEPFLIVYYGTDKGGGWQSLDRPLRTITTLDRFALVKPTSNGHIMRMLQPEELKFAMGYDKNFILSDQITRRNKIKLMGNGVCPPVMKRIIESISLSK
jgi:DNA (cytosine-5)-methyltransferase 1